MGILQAYAIYKYGKKRAQKRSREDLEICTNCGWERYRHSPSGDCPAY